MLVCLQLHILRRDITFMKNGEVNVTNAKFRVINKKGY